MAIRLIKVYLTIQLRIIPCFCQKSYIKKIEKHGYIIINDYRDWPSCREAVTDYRNKNKMSSQIYTLPTVAI